MLGMFQRMRTQCYFNKVNGMVFFDEGHKNYITLYRMAQKYLPTGSMHGGWGAGKTRNMPLTMFPKDANVKHSDLTYFGQIADLVSYAARLKLENERGVLAAKRVGRNHHAVYDAIPKASLNTLATMKRPDAIVPV